MRYKIVGCILYSILNTGIIFSQENKVIFYETNNSSYMSDSGILVDRPVSLAYAPNGIDRFYDKMYLMMITPPGLIHTYFFNEDQRNNILKGITKYKEWNDIAIKNGVTNTKTISKFDVNLITEIDNNDVPTAGLDLTGDLIFFSFDKRRHYLLLRFDYIQVQNAGQKIRKKILPTPILLAYDDVLTLEQNLQDEFIKEKLEAITEKEVADKKVDDLFQ